MCELMYEPNRRSSIENPVESKLQTAMQPPKKRLFSHHTDLASISLGVGSTNSIELLVDI